ncbi:MAG: hypothetical protein U9R44_01790 [Candidatus Omnitrophota bacterium]|nr:hypothetical protein [Candidatus Omnitrophota bacterium]
MDIRNLEKLPDNARKVLSPFLDELFDIYREAIRSVFVYGSVTGRDYNPKTSDINMAVVLDDVSLGKLKPALKAVRSGLKKKITAPLFLTPSYIKMSLDTFPMEFMGMKDTRCVLYGEDILADIEVKSEDLRRECEYQLKGKLLMIRQAYLEQGLNHRGIERLIKASFGALIPVFQNMLRIKRAQTPPSQKEEVLCQLEEEFDVDISSFLQVLRDKKADGRVGGKDAETFLNDFLVQLERLSEIADKM